MAENNANTFEMKILCESHDIFKDLISKEFDKKEVFAILEIIKTLNDLANF